MAKRPGLAMMWQARLRDVLEDYARWLTREEGRQREDMVDGILEVVEAFVVKQFPELRFQIARIQHLRDLVRAVHAQRTVVPPVLPVLDQDAISEAYGDLANIPKQDGVTDDTTAIQAEKDLDKLLDDDYEPQFGGGWVLEPDGQLVRRGKA